MIDFFPTLGFYFHPFWRCCMDLKMQQFGVRFAEWLNWVFLISRLCLLIATSPKLKKKQSDPNSLWGGRLARTQTTGRCRWGDYWWWVRNVDWRVSLIPGAGFKVLAQRGHDHAGIHRMSLTITIIGLSLFLSSEWLASHSFCLFPRTKNLFSCLPSHSLTLPLSSRGSVEPAWQSGSLVSSFLSLWAAEVVWLLIAVCQRDLGSQSKWPISKDEPKLIC